MCAQALNAGLRPGMALADARARVRDLRAIWHDCRADRTFLSELADVATSLTPSVAHEEPNGLVLDITGCTHLFGSEINLAGRLRRALYARGVSQCRLAIAVTPDMARALARFGPEPAISVFDVEAVRELPVLALECGPEDTTALSRAGLKTIGDVASRPSVLFSSRFSQAFTTKLARVLGEEDRHISPLKTVAPLIFDHRCAEPLISHDAIERVLMDLARRASQELEARGEGGRRFLATFFRTDGAIQRIPIETSRPMRDPAVILKLYQDRLEAIADPLDPGFGFDLIRFEVIHAQESLCSQTGLNALIEHDDRISDLCDRLAAMFGRARVLGLVSVDTHSPERAQITQCACDKRTPSLQNDKTHLPRPITLFSRPHPLEIVPAHLEAVPERFRWRRKVHDIVHIEGPERIAEEWWRSATGFGTRDYFRIETADGQRFWIFRSQATSLPSQSAWFLHGVFA